MPMPNLQLALDTSAKSEASIGAFNTGGKFNPLAGNVPSLLGVPWYWFAVAGVAGYLIWKRGGI